jgi:hypothetical protein
VRRFRLLRALTVTALLLASAAAPAGAFSQASQYENLTVEQALRVCAAFEDKDDRLACFEALANSAGEPAPTAAAPSPPSAETAPAVAAIPELVPPASSADVPVAGAPPAATTAAVAEGPRFNFVRSDAASEAKRKRKRHEATVFRAWRNPLGEIRIAMTNGDIWVQAGRGVRYTPKQGETVVLKPGLAGGWTVSMDGGKAGVRARLLEPKE